MEFQTTKSNKLKKTQTNKKLQQLLICICFRSNSQYSHTNASESKKQRAAGTASGLEVELNRL